MLLNKYLENLVRHGNGHRYIQNYLAGAKANLKTEGSKPPTLATAA